MLSSVVGWWERDRRRHSETHGSRQSARFSLLCCAGRRARQLRSAGPRIRRRPIWPKHAPPPPPTHTHASTSPFLSPSVVGNPNPTGGGVLHLAITIWRAGDRAVVCVIGFRWDIRYGRDASLVVIRLVLASAPSGSISRGDGWVIFCALRPSVVL